jgi:hypothetical protein
MKTIMEKVFNFFGKLFGKKKQKPIEVTKPIMPDFYCWAGYISNDLNFDYVDCAGNYVRDGGKKDKKVCVNSNKEYSSNVVLVSIVEHCE